MIQSYFSVLESQAANTAEERAYQEKQEYFRKVAAKILFEWENPQTIPLYRKLEKAVRYEAFFYAANLKRQIEYLKDQEAHLPDCDNEYLAELSQRFEEFERLDASR